MSISPIEGGATPYPTSATASNPLVPGIVTGAGSTSDTTGMKGAGTGTSTTSVGAVDKNMFLKLMVEQLKNQDPMNPTDSSQFLAQTAQFTSLEKLGAVADSSAQALTAQMAFGASGLVGRTVTYTGTDGAVGTGAVGSVRFTSAGPLLGVNGTEIEIGAVTKVGA